MSDDRLLDAHEAARILNVPVSWVREHSGRSLPTVPHIQLGRYKRYRRDQLEEFIERHMVASLPPRLREVA
jgi:hypothetical protein